VGVVAVEIHFQCWELPETILGKPNLAKLKEVYGQKAIDKEVSEV
jgi:hypothetical protein